MEKLLIKNMVCDRCVAAVRKVMDKNKISINKIELGEVSLPKELSEDVKTKVASELAELGFEVIDNRKTAIVEKIKKSVQNYIKELPENGKIKLSAYISGKINYDYSYLSDLFSTVEGQTIEHYFINQRIEKVKELLVYDQLSLGEISYELGFSSQHHLSAQFKKMTGLTPSHFKKIGAAKRKAIDRT